jgi:hypothetical protein
LLAFSGIAFPQVRTLHLTILHLRHLKQALWLGGSGGAEWIHLIAAGIKRAY